MKSIRSKLFATYALLLLLTVALLGVGLTMFVRSFYQETVRGRLLEESRVIGELLKPLLNGYPNDTDIQEIDGFIIDLGTRTSARITLIAPDGVVLGDSAEDARVMDNHLDRPEILAAQKGSAGSSIRFSRTLNVNMLYTAVPLEEAGEKVGFLRLAIPLSQLNGAIRRIQYGLIAGLLFVLLLTLGISLKLSTSLTQPLAQMADVAESIARGDLDSRIYINNKDEIRALAEAVNRMAESLQEKVREVSANRDQLEAILTTMVEGVIVFGNDGKAIMVNPAARHMLGIQHNWQGRRDLEIIRNADLHEKIMKVSRNKVFLEHELSLLIPEKKVLNITLAPVHTKKQAGVLVVFHDITHLRRLEEIRADFAANVSHELRTPLTAIQGFAETLLDGAYSEPEAAQRFAHIIYRESVRLNELIEDVLKLSKIESERENIAREPVDVAELVADVLDMLHDRRNDHTVVTQIPDSLPPVPGDRGLLRQALYNLLDNAVKYTQLHGTIKISAALAEGLLCITVADNGIGIPEEARERIFERFYRVDQARSRRLGGSGLGLAIVKHIVEAHNGRLELDSSEGQGTRVSILVPYVKE